MSATSEPRVLFTRADAACLPLADGSVDLIVTSPPYFALRDYKDGGESLAGQIGSEPTPAEFLDALWACAREWWRVLSPSGSLWVNLGDKFSTGDGARAKSLLMLPARFAIGMTDGEGDPDGVGWILRRDQIWEKANGLPESVTDRCRSSHEYWFHFTKSPRYFSAVDLIRDAYAPETAKAYERQVFGTNIYAAVGNSPAIGNGTDGFKLTQNPLGKLPGSVWKVATEPLPTKDIQAAGFEAHYAAFPSEWPRRLILGWCPPGGVVLDPFGGTGTTAITAAALGCVGISNDLSADYLRLAQWRHQDGRLAAKVAERTHGKPAKKRAARKPPPDGQLDLFPGAA